MEPPKLKFTFGKKVIELTAEEVRKLRQELAKFDDAERDKEVAALNREIARLQEQRDKVDRRPHPPWPFPPVICHDIKRVIPENVPYMIGDFPPFQPLLTCKS